MSAENNADMESDSLSMVDVLAEQSRMQEDASAVLGDSDEQNCTYPKGYVQRQALYACSTCTSTEPAGMCLACSYQCHEGHSLYELYTKRNFRCDCGNSKFGGNKCKLVPTKDEVNVENHYNQNFKGVYCTCARPYPDPEDEVEDEMIQCVVCEDWYHGRHLNAVLPDNEDYEEMICACCMEKLDFLSAYQVTSQAEALITESAEDVTVEVGDGEGGLVKAENQPPVKEESPTQPVVASAVTAAGSSARTPDTSEPPAKRLKTENGAGESSCDDDNKAQEPCLLRELQRREVTAQQGAAFWQEGWREKLCKCSQCMSLYKRHGVEFLLDVGDTVHAYEERGRSRDPGLSELELEQSALSQMNHVQKIEVLQGFIDMKTELREYLKGFADSGKVVCADDIKAFFAGMEARKKARLEGLQYHCK